MVYIALPDDPALKPGMFVHGEIVTGKADVLQVPAAEAVVYKDAKPAGLRRRRRRSRKAAHGRNRRAGERTG